MIEQVRVKTKQGISRTGEEGYTLVAVLAFMTILALMAMAAVPNLRQQMQHEREEEAIFRGEQMAAAIKLYIDRSPTHQPPTSIDQLLEGVPVGTKKLQVLRLAASRDPLSKSGEWKLVRPGSNDLIQFQRAIFEYASGPVRANPSGDPFLNPFAQQLPQITSLLNTGTAPEKATDDADASDVSSGPFVGVASRSKQQSIIHYYGIDHHNEWIFTPLFRY
jgi:type II secretory pathway pseudopilin PulG